MRLAAEYSLLSFVELLELDCVSYRIVVRDAFVYKMKQTQEGRDYLEKAWLMKQTQPDRDELRKKFK